MKKSSIFRARIIYLSAALLFLNGCAKEEKEKEPVVTVQTTPARKASISQIISAEAVVFPLEQAIVAPKITSTVKHFYVQRGSRVKKGALLAQLENADLSAAAESSKGDFEQADAGYVTTVSKGIVSDAEMRPRVAASRPVPAHTMPDVVASRADS